MSGNPMDKAERPVLVRQEDAITSYLEALLSEVPPARVAAPAKPAPVEVNVAASPQVDAKPQVLPRPVAAPPAPVVEPGVAPATSAAPPEPAAVDPVPDWARPRFEALLCRVHQLWLAVPLCRLRHVLRWPEDGVTGLPDAPPWLHGVMPHRGAHLRVIDTAALVLPADRRPAAAAPPGFVLAVGDGRWGLACDALGEVVKLTPEAVRWRSADGRRPWLAGTVRERLCALLEVEALVALARRPAADAR